MSGATILVDVDAVWLRMDSVNLGSKGFEGRWRRLIGSPVRAVDDDLDASQTHRPPDAADQVLHVRLDERLLDCHPADASASGPSPRLNQPGLDGVLERIVQLVAPARKELDAVVGHRIVTGRQHDTEVRVAVLGEKR